MFNPVLDVCTCVRGCHQYITDQVEWDRNDIADFSTGSLKDHLLHHHLTTFTARGAVLDWNTISYHRVAHITSGAASVVKTTTGRIWHVAAAWAVIIHKAARLAGMAIAV